MLISEEKKSLKSFKLSKTLLSLDSMNIIL